MRKRDLQDCGLNGHPGGAEHTRKLVDAAALPPETRILDLGAGDGSSVKLLRSLGYQAEGLDLAPRFPDRQPTEDSPPFSPEREALSPFVRQGNFLATEYPDESWDAVISECSFYISGNISGALAEASRLLKPGGLLLWSDVFFEDPFPLLDEAGFSVLSLEDETPLWREYYLEALWTGAQAFCTPKGTCRYLAILAKKCVSNGRNKHGSL